MQPDQEVISAWRASAPFWEKHREIIRQMFAPVTQALVEDGLIGSGNTVLDIATGPGEPALTIAALVGSEGEVCGIDPAAEMVTQLLVFPLGPQGQISACGALPSGAI